jgi:uncharacterized protein (TIGR03437 family)
MLRNPENLLALALLMASAVPAQITLVGAGHANPAPIQVAPGEVTTLFVSGLNARLASPLSAPSTPLPLTLGGISVVIEQGTSTYPVPLFSISQTNTCATATTNECFITGITVQIPFELVYLGVAATSSPTLVISVNGTASQAFPLSLLAANIHILTSCDSTFVPPLTGYTTCEPLITHADGSSAASAVLVGSISGAHSYQTRLLVAPGETIVIYATGLGPANSSVATGAPTPSPAPQLVGFNLNNNVTFVAGPDAGATPPAPASLCSLFGFCPPAPPGQVSASAWLVPGYAGLYQINITLPAYTAAELPGYCSTPVPTSEVSNVTLSLFSNGSLTSVGLCMQVSTN